MQGSQKPSVPHESREAALAAIDTVLDDQPQSVQAAALAMTQALVQLRDALILEARAHPSRALARELEHANAVLSLVFGIQYPIEGVKREKLKEAREAMEKLGAETRAT